MSRRISNTNNGYFRLLNHAQVCQTVTLSQYFPKLVLRTHCATLTQLAFYWPSLYSLYKGWRSNVFEHWKHAGQWASRTRVGEYCQEICAIKYNVVACVIIFQKIFLNFILHLKKIQHCRPLFGTFLHDLLSVHNLGMSFQYSTWFWHHKHSSLMPSRTDLKQVKKKTFHWVLWELLPNPSENPQSSRNSTAIWVKLFGPFEAPSCELTNKHTHSRLHLFDRPQQSAVAVDHHQDG